MRGWRRLTGAFWGLWLAPQVCAQVTWSPIVTVGPGYVDDYTRQVVRTAGNIVYVVTNASGFDGGTAPSSVRVYKGAPAGNPTSFAEMDAAHRPGNSIRIGGVEAKLAGADNFIQIVYEDIEAGETKYIKYDTQTDTWGTAEVVGALNGQNQLNRYFGRTGLALDANGLAHVITGGTNEAMYYVNRVSGSWSTPLTVASSNVDMKPSMAFDHNGVLHVGYYDSGTNIFYRERDPSTGNWNAIETVASNVSNSQSDQGPSIAIDSSGRVLAALIDGNFTFHYRLMRRSSANTWSDISPGPEVAGHAPSVYIDSSDDIFALEGHDLSIIQPSVEVRTAAGVWGAYSILASGPPTRDGSSSSRWDLLWPGSVNDLDTTAHDENGVDQFGNHYAVTYYLHASLGIPRNVTSGDFDGDGKADIGVFRPSKGQWYVIPSSNPSAALLEQWGATGDIPVRGDFDGDGKTDFAVFRPSTGTWFIIPSSNPGSPIIQQWGANGDIPLPGDYDGDGKTDIAVWRPSTGEWFIIPSSNPVSPIIRQWGTGGDIPLPGDYDSDGKTDIAVWRPSTGTWYIIPSSNPGTPIIKQWGASGDMPVPGDYDGDGKTDIAVWRPSTGTWYIIPSSNPGTPIIKAWGTSGDIPVPVDYDGDRKTDIAIWRPSNGFWFIIPSSTPTIFIITQWGTSGDVPLQKPTGQ